MPTRSLGFQSFYQGQLTAAISDTDTTIPLDVLPTPSEGLLVIESTVSGKREIIYYTSKTATAVVCPAGAGNGRGYDGTTAVSHLQNSAVIMAPVAQMFKSLQDGTSMSSTVNLQNLNVSGSLSVGGQTPTADWSQLASAPNTVTANGNRSYSLVFNGVDYTGTIQAGTRVRTTRTVAAPTQCTSLNGTTQYYSRASASVNGMSFTDDFVVSAWIKLNNYPAAATAVISRFDGTNGWQFTVETTGQIQLLGFNASASNYSYVRSYQSIPLNKWVHISAQLDMSSFTATTTTSYTMIDGVDVPATVARAGTNPTSLIQAGNLNIGAINAAAFFPGKIAQVAVYNAKVAQATIQGYISQGLVGTETSLISAYSFNNSINDLNTTNANNLTANGSAVATNADSPFGGQANGNISSTLDYGIVQSVSFSTNTTAVVQVSEGNTIPTSGGVSALYYSSNKAPYGFNDSEEKWSLYWLGGSGSAAGWSLQTGAATANTFYGGTTNIANIPIGIWKVGYSLSVQYNSSTAAVTDAYISLSTSTSTITDARFTNWSYRSTATVNVFHIDTLQKENIVTNSTSTLYYLIGKTTVAGNTNFQIRAESIPMIWARNTYL